MNNKNPYISVIIPIFNVERYIEKCVTSLLSQTFSDIQYIFINDGSTDNSACILTRVLNENIFSHRFVVTILNFDVKKGIANARNIGLQHATGNYVGFVDGDDWIESNMFAKMYEQAVKTDSDIISCSFVNEYIGHSKVFYQPYSNTNEYNLKKLLSGEIFPSLWCEIVKRSLYINNNINFEPNINMGEDLLVNTKLFFFARSFSYINDALYHYRHTDTSICAVRSSESVSSDIKVASLIDEFITTHGVKTTYYNELLYRKFLAKMPLWSSKSHRDIVKWENTFIESNKHIFDYYRLDWKMKIEFWLAVHGLIILADSFVFCLDFRHRIVQKLFK